ncbi:bifunctional metallophosphatase/5'-nucleotidase [Phytoactinopolyspora halotolerans]|uniref:bifunctional metallophosphatase/5'-nucleotidase n=1 Tax=Phytoactinopolyspora halotolerans TaxID=1981512 RepID=UPI001C20440D|nr:bifunctional UDP-sugar hydrolase/5'-nucleotidase [Phytoactinopolyspora halotolerans]
MRPTRRFPRALAAVTAMGLVGVGLATAPAAADDHETTIDILATNDFHGRLEASGQAAGAAVLAGAVDQMRTENPNLVFAAAGDLIGASTFVSFVDDDHPTIDALNAAGLDVSAVGNHEFDKGYCDLVDRVIPRAEWEYIGANVKVKDGHTHGCENTELDDLAESWTADIDGVTVGFVGAVTEHLPELVSPSGIEQIDVLDIVEETNRVADELKADGADVVVLLVHEGAPTTQLETAIDPDNDFGKIVNGVNANVDAIVSGHTHLAYDHHIEVDEWVDEGRDVTVRPVVSAGQYGYNLNKISFTVSDDDGVSAMESAIVPLTERDDDGNWVPLYEPDEEVQGIVDDAVERADELGAESLGEITADFNRARQSDGAENRGGESTLGNFVADVQLSAARITDEETDVAFMNPGGLRTDMTYAGSGEGDPDGNVTYREAAEVQPFANTLVTMTLTGERVVEVLEEQWQPDGASRAFLKLGVSENLTYTYDPEAAAGEHITSVTIDGEPLDADGYYRVVANSFLASGGDNFTTLAEGVDVADTGQIDLQAMVDYLGQNSPASPDYAQRAVGVSWVSDPDGVYAPGDEVAFDLSSLLFSAGEPVAESVVVSLAGEELGKFDIDPEIVDTTDEVGRASVSVTVPENLGGAAAAQEGEPMDLVVTVPDTGTELTLPITIDAGDGGGDEDGSEDGDDSGSEDGSEDGAEDGSESGDDGGTDDGSDTGSDGGAEAGGDESGAEDGTDAGTDAGAEDGTDSGTDSGGDASGAEDGEGLPDTGAGSGLILWGALGLTGLALGAAVYAASRMRAGTAA